MIVHAKSNGVRLLKVSRRMKINLVSAGCKYLDEIKLIKCGYIENEALRRLIVVKDTLKHLEVVDCANITDGALKSLKNLT